MNASSEHSPSPILPPAVPAALAPIVRAGVRAAREVPGAVALGGTVCALYAGHRLSIDIDFGLSDLRDRFQEVREHLLEVSGWVEASAKPPVLLLGAMDGVQIGFRQLRRKTPMQTIVLETPDGPLRVPTLEELLRTKAFLLYSRNATRDYVDFAALSHLLPDHAVVAALAALDEVFAWERQPSVVLGVVKALLRAEPSDLDGRSFEAFRWLLPKPESWPAVQARCRAIGSQLSIRIAGGES